MFHSECDQLLALEFRTSVNEFNMEVSGRRKPAKENYFFCKHCEDRKAFNRSSGLCWECDEYMCIKCFDTHKEWKLNKGHTLTDGKDGTTKQELTKELVKCNAHPNGFVKYYCTRHHRIGCSKSMVLEHTSCKIELMNDKVQNFKESPSFEEFVEGIKKCRMQSTETVSSIESKKLQLTEANDEFIRDVQEFRVEIISKVNELANAMLQQGKDAIQENIKYMDELKQGSERIMLETTALDEVLESQIGQPYKLFVSSILEGPKLTRVREQIRNLDSKTRITNYKFKRNGNLERVVKDSKQLGQIQEIKEKTEKDSEGTARPKSYTKTARAIAASKTQPLLDRQLVCRNIAVDGEYLSYAPRMPGKIGLYVLNFVTGFEVEIINKGRRGKIVVGFVPENYPKHIQLGFGRNSIGYSLCYGGLYFEHDSVKDFGPKCNVGDRIHCEIRQQKALKPYNTELCAFFVRNGEVVLKQKIYSAISTGTNVQRYPAIELHHPGQKVKVVTDHMDLPRS